MAERGKQSNQSNIVAIIALLIAICLFPVATFAEDIPEQDERGWVDFILVCNEGNSNTGGNVGNTMMVVSMNPKTGKIRLMMMTWDTFVRYEGFDQPRKLDEPFRRTGPEGTLRTFNNNFNMDIKLFMSLNYLNLASMIDSFGGVEVDVSKAEKNALNMMVASKKEDITRKADLGLLSEVGIEMLAQNYYLGEHESGPNTHLNGLQAVGYGWLQYDSVYNCCEREVEVIAALFYSVGQTIREKVYLYTDESGEPEYTEGRREINLDHMTEEDQAFLREQMDPIFKMAYHNLTETNIQDISNALVRAAYLASRQGVNVFDNLEHKVFPLEAKNEYDLVAGIKGHLVDYAANEKEMKEFLFKED